MKKQFILIGIVIMLLIVGFSGCTQQYTNENNNINNNSVTPESSSEGLISFILYNNIHVINPDGTNEKILKVGGDQPILSANGQPILSPNEKKIAYFISYNYTVVDNYADWYWRLYVINSDGTGDTEIYGCSVGLSSETIYRWSPDSKKIVFITKLLQFFTMTEEHHAF